MALLLMLHTLQLNSLVLLSTNTLLMELLTRSQLDSVVVKRQPSTVTVSTPYFYAPSHICTPIVPVKTVASL